MAYYNHPADRLPANSVPKTRCYLGKLGANTTPSIVTTEIALKTNMTWFSQNYERLNPDFAQYGCHFIAGLKQDPVTTTTWYFYFAESYDRPDPPITTPDFSTVNNLSSSRRLWPLLVFIAPPTTTAARSALANLNNPTDSVGVSDFQEYSKFVYPYMGNIIANSTLRVTDSYQVVGNHLRAGGWITSNKPYVPSATNEIIPYKLTEYANESVYRNLLLNLFQNRSLTSNGIDPEFIIQNYTKIIFIHKIVKNIKDEGVDLSNLATKSDLAATNLNLGNVASEVNLFKGNVTKDINSLRVETADSQKLLTADYIQKIEESKLVLTEDYVRKITESKVIITEDYDKRIKNSEAINDERLRNHQLYLESIDSMAKDGFKDLNAKTLNLEAITSESDKTIKDNVNQISMLKASNSNLTTQINETQKQMSNLASQYNSVAIPISKEDVDLQEVIVDFVAQPITSVHDLVFSSLFERSARKTAARDTKGLYYKYKPQADKLRNYVLSNAF